MNRRAQQGRTTKGGVVNVIVKRPIYIITIMIFNGRLGI